MQMDMDKLDKASKLARDLNWIEGAVAAYSQDAKFIRVQIGFGSDDDDHDFGYGYTFAAADAADVRESVLKVLQRQLTAKRAALVALGVSIPAAKEQG